ncbi:MAG: Tad domain-containing protein [Acidiferrobacter sp.]
MHQAQKGQALVFAVIVLLAVFVGGFVLYNGGRLVLTKMHLQNTAESTAYSGAVLVARDYNFSAYANRAMVANQVAIAQMVGLRSWSRYYCLTYNDQCGNQQSSNSLPSQIQRVVGRSEVGAVYGPVLSYYKALSQAVYRANAISDGAIANMANILNGLLSVGAMGFHDAVLADLAAGAANQGLLAQVVAANDPHAQISTVGKTLILSAVQNLRGFTQTYGNSTADQKRFAPVITQGLDAFSQSRSSSEWAPYPLVNPFSLIPYNDQSFTAIWNSYSGGTEFKTGFKTWNAMDVSTVSGFTIWWISIFGVPIPIPVPIWTNPPLYFWPDTLSHAAASDGQSASLATNNNFGEATGSASYGSSYSVNSGPAYRQKQAGAGKSIATYNGLRSYQDVADTQTADFTAPTLTIVLDRPRTTITTSGQLGIASGALATPSDEAGGQVEAMATAQAEFARPQASRSLGGKVVYGNLFNPYWEAHLAPTSAAVRAAAAAAQMAGQG